MADQLEMLQTALTQGLRGITDAARVRLQVAERENDRQFALARERETRNYAEKLAERRRQQAKDDASEERMRSMRNQLSALMPMGTPINANMTEEQLSQEIAKRTRDRQLQYGAEDRKILLDAEIDRVSKLEDAKLRDEARRLGIEQSDSLPIPELRLKVAERKTDENTKFAQANFNSRIDAAKSDPRYSALRSRLGALQSERASLIAQGTMPEPVFDPRMTGQDSLEIYAAMADRPAVMAAFVNLPNAKTRLDALRNGDMQAAVDGLKKEDAEWIRMSIQTEQTGLDQALRSGKYGQFTAAKMAYIERLRRLPQMLWEVDRQINNLYQIGSKEGVYYGLALQFEDPSKLAQEFSLGKPADLQSMPGVGTTGGASAGGMPMPGSPDQIPPDTSAPAEKPYMEGLIPFINRTFADPGGRELERLGQGIANDPLLKSGSSKIAYELNNAADSVGDIFQNVKGSIVGGGRPVRGFIPGTMLEGVGELATSPASMIGRGLQYTEPVIDVYGMAPFRAIGSGLESQRDNIDRVFAPIREGGNKFGEAIRRILGAEPAQAASAATNNVSPRLAQALAMMSMKQYGMRRGATPPMPPNLSPQEEATLAELLQRAGIGGSDELFAPAP